MTVGVRRGRLAMAQVRALTGHDDREREARRRLAFGQRALARGDRDTAGYHAVKGLEGIGGADLPELVVELRRLLASCGAWGFRPGGLL